MKILNFTECLISLIISSIARIAIPVWDFMLGCVAGLIIRQLAGAAFQATFGHLVTLNFQSGSIIPLTLGVLSILYGFFADNGDINIQAEEIEGGGN